MSPSVYVASPLGFSAVGQLYYRDVLLPAIAAAGLEALDPWAPEHADVAGLTAALALPINEHRVAELARANHRIGATNFELIHAADGLLAVVDGNDVDSGTAAEIGAASALGKPIVALRTDFRSMGDNEGSLINLQVEFFVTRNGGSILSDAAQAAARLVELIEAAARR